jgi:CubicO group peptidase (beta-lactamase class C family)
MSTVKTWMKRIIWVFVVLILSINLFILLSGRFYLYKGIAATYLRGESGPTIYDFNQFPERKIAKAANSVPWKRTKTVADERLQEFINYAEKWHSTSLLIIHNDQIIFEKYWGNHHPETVSNSFSAAKTVVSMLIGIAVEDGYIKSIDEPIVHYLPDFSGKGKEKITIRHLLMMASGLDWGESGKNPLSENAESYYGTNLWSLVHRQQVIGLPGRKFIYQSGNSQLLGFILEKATGKTLTAYAAEKLWQPIGAESDAFWSLDKVNGDEKAFCCLYSTTRDFARIGKLLAHQGKFNNKQVIPFAYFNEMVRNPKMTTEEGVPNTRYGLHVWTYNSNGHPVYYCRGIKGQYIIAIPSEDLIIVRTGHQRAPDIEPLIPRSKMSAKYKEKIGHPADLFEYIAMGRLAVKRLK